MADADEDAGAYEYEDREPGPEGDGAEGSDTAGRDEAGDVPAERLDDEGDEGTPPARDTAEPAPEPRGSARLRRLANENREYRDRLDRLERERAEERRQYLQQQQTQTEQQERERTALMTPDERAEYYRLQERQRYDSRMQQVEMRLSLQMDKANFDAKVRTDPVYRRMQEAVEQRFAEQLNKGQVTDRETIIRYLIGDQAVSGGARADAQRRSARRRVESERVAPARPQGDRTQVTRKTSTAEDRLKDVLI
jgi:hypothetical protein